MTWFSDDTAGPQVRDLDIPLNGAKRTDSIEAHIRLAGVLDVVVFIVAILNQNAA